MNPNYSSWIPLKLRYAFLLAITCMQANAQYGTQSGDWPSYGGDTGSTKYSPLTQISAENFGDLEIAWRWTSVDSELDVEALQETNPDVNINNFQGTPLKIGNKLYIITAMNLISALDAATGETLWTYNPEVYLSGPPINIIGYHSRGVAYWSDGDEERILAEEAGMSTVKMLWAFLSGLCDKHDIKN